MLLSQWSQASTPQNHMPFIASSTTVVSQTNPVGSVYMASTSQTASSNRQAMTTQSKLQKALHAPPRNKKLTTPATGAIRLRPEQLKGRGGKGRGNTGQDISRNGDRGEDENRGGAGRGGGGHWKGGQGGVFAIQCSCINLSQVC